VKGATGGGRHRRRNGPIPVNLVPGIYNRDGLASPGPGGVGEGVRDDLFPFRADTENKRPYADLEALLLTAANTLRV